MTTQIEKATSSLKSNISRLMVVLQVFTAAIVLVTIFYIYQFTVLTSAANTCRISLETVALRIDANQILEYAQTGERGEGYEELYNYVSDIRTINNFNALFIMIENGDKYQYIIEGGLNRDESTVSKRLGQQDFKYLFKQEVQKCFDEGTAMSSGVYNSARSDDVVVAVAPIKDARGRVVAVLYADILKGTILNNHRADLFGVLPTAGSIVIITCILVVLLLTLYAQRRIIAPIQEVTGLSAELSAGNTNVEIPDELLRRKDEIGVLSRSFAKMVQSMLTLTGELEPLIETALQEDFNKRADESLLDGVYKEVLEKLNRLLDLIVNKVLFYETLLDAVPLPVSAITTDKVWFYMNKYAITHFAKSVKNPLGMSCAHMDSPLCGGENCMIDQLEKNGLDHIVTPDFEIHGQIYKMHAARVYDKNEKVSCYLQIAEDVTAEMRVEEYQRAEIKKISEEMAKLAAGDFDLQFEQTNETDVYIQRVRENFDLIKTYIMQTVNSFNTYISDISEKLSAMANGDLDQEITLDYCGDFKMVKDSLNEILTKFNDMLNEINSASDQVSGASRSVSAGSHSLAQATTQQVAASQQIKTTVDLVVAKAKENAHDARKASNLVENAKETSLVGAEKMKGMISAMTEINQASGSISKIIKTIEDIAFQTNILALNAAVEAARAGQSGKGFAVVASEVRNLASKSARAAQDTTTLIESTVKKTGKGVNIAGEAAEAFDKILETILEASDIVNGISEATNEQAISIEQISLGAEHISVSAYTNSATAEESASASEEMYTQANNLKEMIKLFKLRPGKNDQLQVTFSPEEEQPELGEGVDKGEAHENEEYDDSKFDFKDGDYNNF